MHEQVLHPDDLADGRLRQLFELWLAAMGGAKMPARKFADPIALHFLFGSLVLFEIERNPLRFRYRLFGTDLSNQLGIDPTGQYVNESKDKQAGIEMACLLNGVAIDGLPCRAFAKTDVCGMSFQSEALALPLSDRVAGRADFILAAQVFDNTGPNQRFLIPTATRNFIRSL